MSAKATELHRLDAQRPWPGLSSFSEADTAYFFGREQETGALVDLISRSNVVVLYGQSGLGKTSLLRAGVFPALKACDHLPVWVRFDLGSDAPELTVQVLQALSAACEASGIEAPKPLADDSLWSYFHRADTEFWGPRNRLIRPLIVLDQFEELFTIGQRDAAAAARSERFASELEALLEQRPPADVRRLIESAPERAADFDVNRDNVRFVVSLREDYLPHLDAWRKRMPSLLARRYRLEPMTRQQALQVVLKGGAELVDDAVAQDVVDFVASGDGQGRVEPAILSVVCEELNNRRLRAGLPRITRQLMSGERGRIIADFYERSFDGIPDEVRDWAEDELLTASGHRDRAAVEDARRAGLDPAHIGTLVDRRVLHSAEHGRVVWVEFTHDLLTEPALHSRNARERQRSQAEAAQREQDVRDKLRRSRRLTAAFGAMTVAMGLLSWWSFQQRSMAQQQTQIAQEARLRASEQSVLAQKNEGEAKQAAAAAARAASEAADQALHAQEAEARARANLSSAEQSALKIARQGLEALEGEWVKPTANGARLVQTILGNIEPLAQQFHDTPALLDERHRLYALAVLIHAGRGDETECRRLTSLAALGDAAKRAWTDETAALAWLAAGQCDVLSAQHVRAGERFAHAARSAQRLHGGSVAKHRILISAALSAVKAARLRYEFELVEVQIKAARQAVEQASRSPGVSADEALGAQLALLAAEASRSPNSHEALELLEQLQQKAKGVTAAGGDALSWRGNMLAYDFDRANTLWRMDRQADAEDLIQRTLDGLDAWLKVDPTHVENQLRRVSAARIHAEIYYRWKRKAQARALVDGIERDLEKLMERQPGHVTARYQLGVLSWLKSKYTVTKRDERLAHIQDVVRTFEALVAKRPDEAETVRSLSIAYRELGDLELEKSKVGELNAAARRAHEDRARAHFESAAEVIGRLRGALHRDKVADMLADAQFRLGDLDLAQGGTAAALDHYRQAAQAHRRVQLDAPSMLQRARTAAVYEMHIARALRQAGRLTEADVTDQATLAALESFRKSAPSNFNLVDGMAWVHRMAAGDHLQQGRLAQAAHSQLRAAQVMADELGRDPLSPQADVDLKEITSWANKLLQPAVEKIGDAEVMGLLAKLQKVRPRLDASKAPPGSPAASDSAKARIPMKGPLIRGDWKHLEPASLLGAVPSLAQPVADLREKQWREKAARTMVLPFYDDAQLVELDVHDAKGRPGVAVMLVSGGEFKFQFTGASQQIHDFNAAQNLSLRTETQARHYLRYFVAMLQGEEGQFQLVDRPGDLLWRAGASASTIAQAERYVEPWHFARQGDGSWMAQGSLQYAAHLFLAKLQLTRDGKVDMQIDQPVTNALPLSTVRFEKGVRVLDGLPSFVFTRDEAVKARQWKAAGNASKAIVDGKRARFDRTELAKQLPEELLKLSWYRLLSGEAQAALDATTEGLELSAGNLSLQTHRAHALLLLGRDSEAMALYREHIGKRVGGSASKLWQDEILNDLAKFKEYGLIDLRFDAVRSLMQEASK